MTKEEFTNIVSEAKNKRDLLFRLGRKDNGAGVRYLSKLLKEFNVDISNILKRKTRDIEKSCILCEKVFQTTDGAKGRKCCSVECATRCAQTFVDTNKLSIKMKKLFAEGKIHIPISKGGEGKKTAKREKYNCRQCGKTFIQTLRESGMNKMCACSVECRKILMPTHYSENRKKQYENGKQVYGGKTKWFIYKDIKVQGTYELRACKIFDEMINRGDIKSWEKSPASIKYIGIDGKYHNYLIDFRINNVDGTYYFVETKGRVRENDELKWKAVRENGHELQVWFITDIKNKEKQFFERWCNRAPKSQYLGAEVETLLSQPIL